MTVMLTVATLDESVPSLATTLNESAPT